PAPAKADPPAAAAATTPPPAAAPPAPPRPPTPDELYMAKLDAAVEPLRAIQLSDDVGQKLRTAVKSLQSGDPGPARALRGQLTDPTTRKLIEWLVLRAG
ncbi:MAG TPA: lytic transglycosylase domain-containing protein, partial [Hyphomicrobiaceae bacterium]|nr:lytic transglycosylase domain-containing protein [Hyphomicrobiaceae bacterium]